MVKFTKCLSELTQHGHIDLHTDREHSPIEESHEEGSPRDLEGDLSVIATRLSVEVGPGDLPAAPSSPAAATGASAKPGPGIRVAAGWLLALPRRGGRAGGAQPMARGGSGRYGMVRDRRRPGAECASLSLNFCEPGCAMWCS